MGYSGECNLAVSPGQPVLQHTPVLCPLPSPSGVLPSLKQRSCCTPCSSYFTPGADISPQLSLCLPLPARLARQRGASLAWCLLMTNILC